MSFSYTLFNYTRVGGGIPVLIVAKSEQTKY